MKTNSITWTLGIISFLLCHQDCRAAIYSAGDHTSITRMNGDGSNLVTLVDNLNGIGPRDVVVDPANGKMYWTSLQQDIIQRANLNGSDVETVFLSAGSIYRPINIDLDTANGKLYWLTQTTIPGTPYKLRRGNTDGTGMEDLVTVTDGVDVELDLNAGKIYWTDWSEAVIKRSNLDGSSIETVLSAVDGLSDPTGLALDISNNRIYWGDADRNDIRYSTLDGDNVQTLFDTGIDYPFDLEFDTETAALYWTDNQLLKTERYDNGVREVILDGVYSSGIGLGPIPEPSAAVLALVSALCLAFRRSRYLREVTLSEGR